MDFIRKWFPFLLFGFFAVIGIVFMVVMLRPKNKGASAKYLDGRDLISVGGIEYALINDIESKTFVGSEVSDAVKAMRGDERAKIISGGIMTLAVLYAVRGDTEEKYLIDSVGRIYAKKEFADSERARLNDITNYPVIKIVDSEKSLEKLQSVDREVYDRILSLKENPVDPVTVTDQMITESYGLRREIFGLTEDGIFYRALDELFIYEEKVYVTTSFIPAKDKKDKPVLTGVILPDDLQGVFRPLFH